MEPKPSPSRLPMKTSGMQCTFDFTEDGIEFGIIENHPLNDADGS